MAFNPLTDALPDEWRGVPVNTDFRQVLRFFQLMSDKELDQNQKAVRIIKLFFSSLPPDCGDLWEFLEYYTSGGQEKKNDEAPEKKTFDFQVDAGRVLAAFQQVYSIDLTTEKMHWWRFLELFRNLPEGTTLARVIEIRTKKIPKNGDREYIRELRKAKRLFALEEDDPHSLADWFKGL